MFDMFYVVIIIGNIVLKVNRKLPPEGNFVFLTK